MNVKLAGAFLTLVLALGLLLLAAAKFYLPDYLRQKMETAVHEKCTTCHLKIADLELSFWSWGSVVLRNLRFTSGDKEELRLRMRCEELKLDVDLLSLFSRLILFKNVVAEKYEVFLVNGDKKAPKAGDKKETGSDNWELEWKNATFKNGFFTYTRNTEGTTATLHIHDINLHFDDFGTAERWHDRPMMAEAHFQIEKSGDLRLKIRTPVHETPLKINLQLDVRDQNLEDLNSFFEPNAGVLLKGTLKKGQGRAQMTGTHLTASVSAKYQDFALKLKKAHDRSEIAAFFTSLGASILMNEKNLDKPHEDRTREVSTDRREGEPIVSFLLRGLKEAAIQVAEAP